MIIMYNIDLPVSFTVFCVAFSSSMNENEHSEVLNARRNFALVRFPYQAGRITISSEQKSCLYIQCISKMLESID